MCCKLEYRRTGRGVAPRRETMEEKDMKLSWTRAWFVGAVLMVFFAAPPATADDGVSGKVLETMDSGGYTYLLVEEAGGARRWAAVPQTFVRKGDMVELFPGMEMGSYTSPTLGRTFDGIVFSSGIKGMKRLVGGDGKEADEVPAVAKAEGPDAYTIAELYAAKKDMDGKTAVVRGKVYKVSKYNGLNWLRIKDGSGSRKRGNHKLVVTTTDSAAKGDIVTVRGVMRADKSIGALTYEIIIEDARVTVDGK